MTLQHITRFKIFSSDLSSYLKKLKILSNAIQQNKSNSKIYSGKSSLKSHKVLNINKYHLKSNYPTEFAKSRILNNYMSNTHSTAFERGRTEFPIFHSITLMKKQQPLQAQQKFQFSTFKALLGKKDITPSIDKCDPKTTEKKKKKRGGSCPTITMPPCLKYHRPPGKVVKISKTLGCGTICMPCCPKARYPPICYVATKHRKCSNVLANPRPAYSECHRDRSKCTKSVCDCCVIKPPPCKLLPDLDEECM